MIDEDPFRVANYWRAWRIWGREVEKIPDSVLDTMDPQFTSLIGEPAHLIPSCGCTPHHLCAEGSRLSTLASAVTPTYSWPATTPAAVQAYEVWNRALDRYWAHIRPDNPNARQEWHEFLVRSGM